MAQTLPSGVVVPDADGNEQISATGVAEMRTLGASVDTALAAKASTSYVDSGDQAVTDSLMPRVFYRGPLPMNTNVDDAHTLPWAGMWTISNATFAESITGLPEQVPSNRRLGQFLIMPIGSGVASQFYFPYGFGNVTELWYRNTEWAGSPANPHRWNPWTNIAGGGAGSGEGFKVAGAGMANEILREQMARRRGGTIGIGAKGALAIRFDHGLNAFRSEVVPLLRKWNLPSSQAYLSEMFDGTTSAPDESTESSWAEVRGWALRDGVEPMAHSATHNDAGTEDRLIAEIVGCFTALSAAIPESAIESWAVPGGGGTEYMGFNDGDEPDRFYDTRAGALLMSTYAFSMGHIGGAEWSLDGKAPQGSRHSTVDTSQALNAARSNIQRAIDHRSGYVVMLHPRLMGSTPNHTTVAELDDFLGYVAGLRDAGQLEVMTIGGMVHARSGDNRRLNLLNAGHFPEDWEDVWAVSGTTTRQVENGVAYLRTVGALTQTILNRRVTPHRGAMFEVAATVRTTTSGSIRLAIPGLAGVSRDFTLSASDGWHEVRQFVTFPLNASDNYEVEVRRVSGTVDILNVRVQPI